MVRFMYVNGCLLMFACVSVIVYVTLFSEFDLKKNKDNAMPFSAIIGSFFLLIGGNRKASMNFRRLKINFNAYELINCSAKRWNFLSNASM
jgi:hypothetical protein